MGTYPFNHEKKGSLLYKKETYHFRYKGVYAAEIDLFTIPGEGSYFECRIHENSRHWAYLPRDLCQFHSASSDLFQHYNFSWEEFDIAKENGFFASKEEALQRASTIIETILSTFQSKKW